MFGWLGQLVRRALALATRDARAKPHGRPSMGLLGPRSEQVARTFLERAGFHIIAANYRCPMGELDLVAEGEGRLVFVEVKARRLPAAADPAAAVPRPESAVGRGKQKKVGRAARYFCRTRRCESTPVRFDVIAIDWPPSGDPIIRHHKAAFRPDV